MNTRTMHLAGDSTMCDYERDRLPRAGWGMAIGHLLAPDVVVRNLAQSGRSSRSFIDEGHWSRLIAGVRPGDAVMVQFGHNDEKEDPLRHTDPASTFQDNLSRFVEESRKRGAEAFLLTPVERRHFEGTRVRPSHGAWAEAVRSCASRLGAPLLDLCETSRALYEELGPGPSARLFMHLGPGEWPGWPDGQEDNTHFRLGGAAMVAELVAQLMGRWPQGRIFLP